jgi:luciferase-type oxidoreductase
LSNGRLLLGVASGDRPVEYPIFERDFASRGERFREQVAMVHDWGAASLPDTIELLPRPNAPLPLLAAGLAQQTPQWIGQHMDGCLAYPGTPEDHARRSAQWRAVAGESKPYVSFIHLDLADDADAPLERYRFGGRMGRHALVRELAALHAAGVQHVGLHLRRNRRPLDETMEEIAAFVLPVFHAGMHLHARAEPAL